MDQSQNLNMEIEIDKEYYPTGEIMREFSFVKHKNGLKAIHGTQKYYYTNGLKCEEFSVENNSREGIRQVWEFNGTRNFVQNWKNNQRIGPEIDFKYKKTWKE